MNLFITIFSILFVFLSIILFRTDSFSIYNFSKKTRIILMVFNIFLNSVFSITIIINFIIHSNNNFVPLIYILIAQILVVACYSSSIKFISWKIGNDCLKNNILTTIKENPNCNETDLLNLCILQNRLSFPVSLIKKNFYTVINKMTKSK